MMSSKGKVWAKGIEIQRGEKLGKLGISLINEPWKYKIKTKPSTLVFALYS